MAITSTVIRVYSDALCTNLVKTVNGTTSLSQTVAITELAANTTYYIKAFATDGNNLTGESIVANFTTSGTTYVFSNWEVSYENDYDKLFCAVDVAGPSGTHFTECGIQFATNSHFTGNIDSYSNTTSPANFLSGDITGLSEHTTYYFRFFANSTEYGYQTWAPQNNTITTLYDEPTLTIVANSITDTSANLVFTYSGNYPVDTSNYSNMNATYMVNGGTPGSETYLQFHNLDNNVPETFSLTGLTPNTTYYVEWNVTLDPGQTYEREKTQSITFSTLAARPTVVINSVTDITPSSCNVNITIS